MKKKLIAIAKKVGWTVEIEHDRLDTHSMFYSIGVSNNDESIGNWEGHYFIGEPDSSGNSGKSMLEDFETYLKSL